MPFGHKPHRQAVLFALALAFIMSCQVLLNAPDKSVVELVVYPPRKSFYELLSEQLSGSGDSAQSAAITAWLSANLSSGEIEALRIMRGPFAMFRRGEPLALLPVTFLR